jgi:protein tyrosine/serine phosphatase
MKRLPTPRTLWALLPLLLCLPALAADPPGLPNFHTVAPGIYRGAAPTPEGLQRLKVMGVRTIIDLRIAPREVHQEGVLARGMGFHWINLPMGSDPPTPREVSTLLGTLRRAPQQPVFVHCQHGADRTGCMIGIWRVTQQGWTYPQALAEMRRYGFQTRWVKLSAAVRQRVHTQ